MVCIYFELYVFMLNVIDNNVIYEVVKIIYVKSKL